MFPDKRKDAPTNGAATWNAAPDRPYALLLVCPCLPLCYSLIVKNFCSANSGLEGLYGQHNCRQSEKIGPIIELVLVSNIIDDLLEAIFS